MMEYIVGFESRVSADHEIIDYRFSFSPNDAMRWQLRDRAESMRGPERRRKDS